MAMRTRLVCLRISDFAAGYDLKRKGSLNEHYHPDTGEALSHKGFVRLESVGAGDDVRGLGRFVVAADDGAGLFFG